MSTDGYNQILLASGVAVSAVTFDQERGTIIGVSFGVCIMSLFLLWLKERENLKVTAIHTLFTVMCAGCVGWMISDIAISFINKYLINSDSVSLTTKGYALIGFSCAVLCGVTVPTILLLMNKKAPEIITRRVEFISRFGIAKEKKHKHTIDQSDE